ncbi:ABC-three component system protein [Amycolatopsis rifamycinica]|uniref:ABC-three component system protein n=1 Tax=Amycolatopsis rifamycinica TaxID=287986 RepID=UPI001269C512|nr:ABC-three component system protein [Amycolatopsis rifamycinica]
MTRDEVPRAQEKLLALRSGNACAYPKCGVSLILEAEHPDDSDKTVGKVAHICAASEGGPRYDPNMTSKERSSAANLIFLCGPHHDGIDSQLNHHTVEFLRDAKAKHEQAIARAAAYAMGQVRFDHLEIVCRALQLGCDDINEDIVMPLEVDDKIRINELGDSTREQILLGLAKVEEVKKFIHTMDTFKPNFGLKLAARFKQEYFGLVADGLHGDELYSSIVYTAQQNAGPVDNPEVRAAVLAVVAYLFSTCEIFEHEPTAA